VAGQSGSKLHNSIFTLSLNNSKENYKL